MEYGAEHGPGSWLSLVAETAGVSGAMVARIELCGLVEDPGPVRALVQVVDRRGRVVGASQWEGERDEFVKGIALDLGCDLKAALGCQLVGWICRPGDEGDPWLAIPSDDAASCFFDPARSMKLILHSRSPLAFQAA